MANIEVDVKDVTSFRPVILSMMRKLRVPAKDRDDFEQDCYVQILEKTDKISAARDPKLYVFELCKNLWITKKREEESEYKTLSMSVGEVEHAANKIPFVSSEFYEQYGVTDEQLQEAMSRLSPENLEVLKLYYFQEGSSLATLAQKTGSVSKSKTALSRAKQELKKILEKI